MGEPDAQAMGEPDTQAVGEPDARVMGEPDARAMGEPGAQAVEEPGTRARWQLAECFVPGITPASAAALARRIRAVLAEGEWNRADAAWPEVPRAGVDRGDADEAGPTGVGFLGALLIPEDEVLLCLFTGAPGAVRRVSEEAGLPFERVIGCTWLDGRPAPGWPQDVLDALQEPPDGAAR